MVQFEDTDNRALEMSAEAAEEGGFPLGQLLATRGALEALEASRETPREFLARHGRGDWGELCHEDRRQNDQAVVSGARILSAYTTKLGARLWVITEAANEFGERASTTILLPQEY
jgi:hypothetical protein